MPVFEKVGKKVLNQRISRAVRGMAISAIKEMSLLAMEIPGTGEPGLGAALIVETRWPSPAHGEELLTNRRISASPPAAGAAGAEESRSPSASPGDKGLPADPQTEIMITAGGCRP